MVNDNEPVVVLYLTVFVLNFGAVLSIFIYCPDFSSDISLLYTNVEKSTSFPEAEESQLFSERSLIIPSVPLFKLTHSS